MIRRRIGQLSTCKNEIYLNCGRHGGHFHHGYPFFWQVHLSSSHELPRNAAETINTAREYVRVPDSALFSATGRAFACASIRIKTEIEIVLVK